MFLECLLLSTRRLKKVRIKLNKQEYMKKRETTMLNAHKEKSQQIDLLKSNKPSNEESNSSSQQFAIKVFTLTGHKIHRTSCL